MSSIAKRTVLAALVIGIVSCRAPSPRSANQWEVERFARLGALTVAELSASGRGLSQPVRYVTVRRQGTPQLLVGVNGLPVTALDESGRCYVECDDGDCLLTGRSRQSSTRLPAECHNSAVVACGAVSTLLACDGQVWTYKRDTWLTIHQEPDAIIAGIWQIGDSLALARYRNLATHPEVFSGGLLRIDSRTGRTEAFRVAVPRQNELFIDQAQRSPDGTLWVLEEGRYAPGGYPSRLGRLDVRGAWFVMTRRLRPGKTQIRAFDVSSGHAWVAVQTFEKSRKGMLQVAHGMRTRLRLLRSDSRVDAFGPAQVSTWSAVDVCLAGNRDAPEAPVGVTSLIVQRDEAWLGTYSHGVAVVDLESGDVLDWIWIGRSSRNGIRALDIQGDLPHVAVPEGTL